MNNVEEFNNIDELNGLNELKDVEQELKDIFLGSSTTTCCASGTCS